ncbi:MAG: hypothetical protein CMJ89_02815 [Planctomycetes bacterium]|nr:hypothetical protein [Planctomycetota bacterium]
MGRSRKTRPPLWLWIPWVLLATAVSWLWFEDPDKGIRNVLTMMAALLAATLGLGWFSLGSGYSGRLRASVGISVLGVVAILCTFFRVEGYSGSMIPSLVRRFGSESFDGVESSGLRRIRLETSSEDFPGFLGAGRNLSVPALRWHRDWDAHPPRILWKREVGSAWSGFAIVGGYAFTQEQWGGEEVCTAYELGTGEPVWASRHPTRFDNVFGGLGPRSTPEVFEGSVFGLGARAHLFCLDGETGDVLWERDLLEHFGLTQAMEEINVPYGRANSPLVVGELVILPGGGDESRRMAGLIACDRKSGEVVWESPARQISYSSPSLVTLAGIEQIVIVNEDSVTGHAPATGEILWEAPWPGPRSRHPTVSQATVAGPHRLLLSKGYGRGATLLELSVKEGELDARVLWRNRRSMRTKFTSPVIHEGYIFGLAEERLECVDLETGERVWREGKYGHGQLLLAGRLLLIMSEWGELSLVEATPESPNRVLGSVSVLEGKCWNTLAVAGNKVLVRSDVEAACVEVALEE